jgi:replication factor C subunit 3/5
MNDIPWVEKYRPKSLNGVVLDDKNNTILKNIILKKHFPNLLFYGPPGTGKTTSMLNLINTYQKDTFMKKVLCIHLNASDERGIDTIRHQISLFVNSNGLFSNELKFIILDEVDYMTKSAQQGLKYLIENTNNNVRYCLICNYISKIEKSLQSNFLKLKFNSLPKNDIVELLKNITEKENVKLTSNKLSIIQKYFESDIRSMINYIQINKENVNIIDDTLLNSIIDKKSSINKLDDNINQICIKYNVDKYSLIKEYVRFIIINKKYPLTTETLNKLESIMRNIDTTIGNNYNNILFKLLTLESS